MRAGQTQYVKASGGCSAPAGKDQAAALANVGRMKFRVEGPVAIGKPALAQLMISHPLGVRPGRLAGS